MTNTSRELSNHLRIITTSILLLSILSIIGARYLEKNYTSKITDIHIFITKIEQKKDFILSGILIGNLTPQILRNEKFNYEFNKHVSELSKITEIAIQRFPLTGKTKNKQSTFKISDYVTEIREPLENAQNTIDDFTLQKETLESTSNKISAFLYLAILGAAISQTLLVIFQTRAR